jgi:HtrA serine peptidase 2
VENDHSRRVIALLAVASAVALTLATDQHENSIITQCEGRAYGRELSSNFVADAIEIVAPAVVNIMSYVDGLLVAGISTGSGFIITEDGFVVTNAHVVSSSTDGKVLVTTQNGVKRTGTVHSMDTQSDIALVKIDSEYMGEKFPIVSMGSSSKVRAGEFVVALGSPIQLQNSASFGIVSASARHASELGFTNNRAEYIQTDAAINQGNSGGPLINIAGQVIGINVMKAKGVDGISFAIPVDAASHVIKQLMLQKRVIRPYVGLKMTNYLPARSLNQPSAQAATSQSQNQGQQPSAPRSWWGNGGAEREARRKPALKETFYDTQKVLVLVERVTPGSPADKCGIRR